MKVSLIQMSVVPDKAANLAHARALIAAEAEAGADDAAWMFVSPDRSRAFMVYVLRLATPGAPARRIKLQGLDPQAVYHIDELDADFGGDELMFAGLATPYAMRDFEALSFTLTRKG